MQTYQFDCQNMPAEVKSLFFDSYRTPNNTVISVYVAEEREPIRNWLVENGANLEDDVTILFHWKEEDFVSDKFNFDGEVDDDDDDDDDEEEPKPKKQRKVRVEISEDADIPDYNKIYSGTPDVDVSIDSSFLDENE